jgi:sucrose-phosphate synthase
MAVKKDNSGMYILMFSLHGLLRGEDPELGRDADTGGQIKYVLELVRKLAHDRRVERVDLLTRMVIDPKVDGIYAQAEEKIGAGARIIRIPCGPRRYLRKEVLWPYLDGFSDQAVQHIRRVGRVPDLIHAHYADAGYVGGQVARLLGVPFVFTGHSLGRVKQQRLIEKKVRPKVIEERYNITRRIDAEEFALDTAMMVVASTTQEVEEQYKLYEYYDPARMKVIPPGVDLEEFFPPKRTKSRAGICQEIRRFLHSPNKPLIFAMSRADERKNIETLIHAYGGNTWLQKHANLLIVAGSRDDIRKTDAGTRRVLFNLLYLIDKYDLYGKVAYPKDHRPQDVPEMYRITAKNKGVFVNPALTEPFGLTLIEAAACGVPLVATNDGGPQEIIGHCKNGELIDPLNPEEMGAKIQSIISDPQRWRELSTNGLRGVKKYFSWRSHVKSYMNELGKINKKRYYRHNILIQRKSRLPTLDRLVISDIDNTLIGDDNGLDKLIRLLKKTPKNVGFGIATGRRLDSAVEILKKYNVPTPDIFITAVGSEIHYGEALVEDRTWRHHLDYFWSPERIREVLAELPGLMLQEETEQRRFKISYYLDEKKAPGKRKIVRHLRQHRIRAEVIHSHGQYLDILPIRASKGYAVRYLGIKWDLPPEHILVSGDSGNDAEMLSGDVLGVVVANYSPELKKLRGKPRIYFSGKSYAWGIIDGIEHFDFLGDLNLEDEFDQAAE